MRPLTRSARLTLVLSAGVAAAVGLTACASSLSTPEVDLGGAGAATAPNATTAQDGGSDAAGLPCDVAALLSSKCWGCHSSTPSAPMALVTYADLTGPAKSDPTRKVFEVALDRLRSSASPMPPSAPLAADDIATFAAWADAGAPETTCTPVEAGSPPATLPACALSSDCPGNLICREGTCDVECATDKDCSETWSCIDTRCHPPEAGAADAGAPVAIFNAIDSIAAWTTGATGLPSGSYNGSAFDGRYMYFAPDGAMGTVLRYDTTGTFDSAQTWTTFDLLTIDPSAKNYRGALFDGRYLYLVPSSSGRLARYDPQIAYRDPTAWKIFNLSAVTYGLGFAGATFDGRFIYLVPVGSPSALRYDTAGAVDDTASWSTFTMTTVDPKAHSFVGAVYDGHYVYYVPFGGSAGPAGTLARYDAQKSFGDLSAWTTVDISTFSAKAAGYRTGAFDGRYLYLVPGWMAPTPAWATSTVARFDTQAALGVAASWSFFDTSAVDANALGFNAATFDGRHVILAPGFNGNKYHGMTIGLDTQGDFGTANSWSKFDLGVLSAPTTNPRGAAFDGRYVYLAPASGVAARFEARSSAASPPPRTGASFY